MKLKIALDFDNVIYSNKYIYELLKNNNFQIEDIKTWKMLELPFNIRKEILQYFKKPNIMCNKDYIIEGAQSTISSLSEEYEIIIITNREDEEIKKATQIFIKELFPEVSKVFFTNSMKNKNEILISENVSLFVDDHPNIVIGAISAGIPTLLLSNKYTPHNHRLAKIIENINHIKQIKQYLINNPIK